MRGLFTTEQMLLELNFGVKNVILHFLLEFSILEWKFSFKFELWNPFVELSSRCNVNKLDKFKNVKKLQKTCQNVVKDKEKDKLLIVCLHVKFTSICVFELRHGTQNEYLYI